MHVTECHVVLGEKQIENVKEETEKKKNSNNSDEDVCWKCLRLLQWEHFTKD